MEYFLIQKKVICKNNKEMSMKNVKELIELGELVGKRLLLRPLLISDVTQRYVDWLNDPEVNQFIDIRDVKQNIDMVREYVQSYEGKNNKLLLGIFEKGKYLHIGNITISSIDWKNGAGSVGIAVGDKVYWGKGYATEALSLASDFSFSRLKLHRLEAWISANNLPSQKLFKKVGFVQEGILKDRVKFDTKYVDALIFGLVNKEA